MPRKALAALTGPLVAAALIGCSGGSGGDSTNSTTAHGQTAPVGPVAAKELPGRVHGLSARRRRNSAPSGPVGNGNAPVAGHPDSGGGSAQFRRPGDNSIQEYGHEASSSERERAAWVLHGYLDALAAGRWKAACDSLSAGAIVTLERVAELSQGGSVGAGCPTILAALGGGANRKALARAAEVDVGSLRVRGGRSFILYRDVRGRAYAMPMARELGEWKMATLEGSPLP